MGGTEESATQDNHSLVPSLQASAHYRSIKYKVLLRLSHSLTRVATNYLMLLNNWVLFAARNCAADQTLFCRRLSALRRLPPSFHSALQITQVLLQEFQAFEAVRVDFFSQRQDTLHSIVAVIDKVVKDSKANMEAVRGYFHFQKRSCTPHKVPSSLLSPYSTFDTILQDISALERRHEEEQLSLQRFIGEEIIENVLDNNISSYNQQYAFQKQNISRLGKSIMKRDKELVELARKIVALLQEKKARLETRRQNDEDVFLLYVSYAIQVTDQLTLLKQYAQEVLDFWETFQEFEVQRLKQTRLSFHKYFRRAKRAYPQEVDSLLVSLDAFRGLKVVKERFRFEKVLSAEQLAQISQGSHLKAEALSFMHLEMFFIEDTLSIPFRQSGMLSAIHQARMQQEDGGVEVWVALTQDAHLHLFEEACSEVSPPLISFRCSQVELHSTQDPLNVLLVAQVRTFVFLSDKKQVVLRFGSRHQCRQFVREVDQAQVVLQAE